MLNIGLHDHDTKTNMSEKIRDCRTQYIYVMSDNRKIGSRARHVGRIQEVDDVDELTIVIFVIHLWMTTYLKTVCGVRVIHMTNSGIDM